MSEMGTMHTLLPVTLLLYWLTYVNGLCSIKCNQLVTVTGNCTELYWSEISNCNEMKTVNVTNNFIKHVKTFPNLSYEALTSLDMSYNSIQTLPEDFLYNAASLEVVNLAHNVISNLPEMFLVNSSALKHLSLEGNPLSSIPASVFQPSLQYLSINCECTIVEITRKANTFCHNGTICSFRCQKGLSWIDIEEFYQNECKSVLFVLYIVIAIVTVALLVGGVTCFIYSKKKKGANFESKENADKSPAHGQPRYMTRNMDTISPATNQTRLPGRDYENVVVGQWHPDQEKPYTFTEERRWQTENREMKEDDIYLESDVTDGDQPIYTNTQNMYYSYTEPGQMNNTNKEEDDVYILPDQ
uniref:Leucine-rich repeat-containing protein 25 n=1 Tax=Xenopus tropicalis TaxID=8364 RepID=A0A803JIY5_XENTR